MQVITTHGLDIAKSVFQVHGIDAEGNVVVPPSAQAALRAGILSGAATVPGRHRSLCFIASLVMRTPGTRPHCSPNAAGLCEALHEAAQERCH